MEWFKLSKPWVSEQLNAFQFNFVCKCSISVMYSLVAFSRSRLPGMQVYWKMTSISTCIFIRCISFLFDHFFNSQSVIFLSIKVLPSFPADGNDDSDFTMDADIATNLLAPIISSQQFIVEELKNQYECLACKNGFTIVLSQVSLSLLIVTSFLLLYHSTLCMNLWKSFHQTLSNQSKHTTVCCREFKAFVSSKAVILNNPKIIFFF